ncbi:MAG TPA: DUF1835 domain-containing protein [Bryobacteraceae bacterium]|nr:DUF1835 domain-containing protein [Bryobacteraceae bacterium]
MVHIVNGDAVAGKLRRWAGEPRLIVWHDILHEGPVPAGLRLEDLTEERAQWLEANGYGSPDKLRERDRQLRRLVARDSLWLWFEDDLYDQLQLLQVLHFLHTEALTESPHFLVDIPRSMEVEQMAALAANKKRLTPEMIATGVRAWEAFTEGRVAALLETDLRALPHLRSAITRLLEHTPENNRVQRTIVDLLAEGGKTATQLFEEYQQTEERPFLGDTTFFRYLDALAPRVAKDPRGIYRLLPDTQ